MLYSKKFFYISAASALASAVLAFAFVAYQHHLACDDAFISYTYARNLAEGKGLTWTTGERVEGYTNFLLTLVLAGGSYLGVVPEKLSPIIGIASGLALLLVLWLTVFRESRGRPSLLLLAPVLFGLNRSLGAWSTSGLETSLFAVLSFAGAIKYLSEREDKTSAPWQSALLLSLSVLTRPEGIMISALVGAFFLFDVITKRRGLKELFVWAAVLLLIVGGHFIWRYTYYGFFLPNTFYAKTRGDLLSLGIDYLGRLNHAYRLETLGVIAFMGILFRPTHRNILFAVISLLYLAYAVSVGGDFLEFRFALPALPFLYFLVAAGLQSIWELGNRWEGKVNKALPATAIIFSVFLLAVNIQGSFSERPVLVSSQGVAQINRVKAFADLRTWTGEYLKEKIENGVLPADLRIEAGGVGILPYYTRWYTIDRFGLNDLYLARTSPIEENTRSGHTRAFDLSYTKKKNVAMVVMSPMTPLIKATPRKNAFQRIKEVNEKVAWRNEETDNENYKLRPKIYRFDKEHILAFGTNMEEGNLAPLFSKLEEVPQEDLPPQLRFAGFK